MEREAAPDLPRESILLSPEEAELVHNLTVACGGWGGDEKTGRSRIQLPTRPHRERDKKKPDSRDQLQVSSPGQARLT